jgi:hypothetical protein
MLLLLGCHKGQHLPQLLLHFLLAAALRLQDHVRLLLRCCCRQGQCLHELLGRQLLLHL